MLNKWGLRSAIVLGFAIGLFLLFATALQVPAVGKAMGSPQACGTCHVMDYEVKTLLKSAHHELSCLDCHSALGFVERPVDEVKTASRHLYVFMTNTTPDIIKPNHEAKEIIQANCVRCHTDTLGTTHIDRSGKDRFCFECHRDTPHGTPMRN